MADKHRHKSRVALVGAGKIGDAIAYLLLQSGDYDVLVLDQNEARLRMFAEIGISTLPLDASQPESLPAALKSCDVVINAAPFYITSAVALAAQREGIHYLDLSEDLESARTVKAIAADATSAFMPQCGLAPGFVSIVAQHLASGFDSLRDVYMRVGALPIYPSNSLQYNLTWSTDGLINEYCNRCEAIIDGERVETQPLEEVDRFSLDGIDYEAFNTSGGLGTLCETLQGKVQNLNKDVLETALPITYQDVVLVFVTVSGMKQGLLTQETYAKKIYGQTVDGKRLSAIQLTTASGLCVILDLLMEGAIPQRGLVKQEEIDLNVFLANRFAKYYQ
ncbi:MAG: saccharopine dehydrogenase [Betaproteobacteria bacterium 13_1_20CM_3_63_8]|nr:MAG: saccharopine dehydrogenase [Betaproteobacteria bacterium 13_1_20CM_3_63_8]